MMKTKLLRFGLLLVLVIGITLAIIYRDQIDSSALEQWVQNAGAAGPVVFMLVYAIGTVFFLPGSVLTLAGGALFGPVWGTLYNLTGATLGAALAFLVARYLASDWVANKTGGRVKQLITGVETEGWRFVAFVRLVPLFPFNLLNYALGLTRIGLWPYVIATYIFMLPGAFAYTYLGYAGREAVAGDMSLVQLIQMGSIALALLASVAFIPRIIGRLRRKPMLSIPDLKKRLDAGDELLILDVRNAEDFVGEQGHIVNAINIPLKDLSNRINELAGNLEKTISIVCRTDRRSLEAAELLLKQGFADVHVAQGGMTEWNRSGFAVEH
ncbi:MAG TPA: sulfurtransferase [Acidiferrobacteraceae bacterium]|nr:sulfurtransferase [Acidiferrobacteraceae bacterium]